MTLKKKLGSKLASSVRQVKLQREQTPVVPAKTVTPAKAGAPSAPVVVAAKPVAPRVAQQTAVDLEKLHPSRVWPD